MKEYLMKSGKILITGGAGFFGGHICEEALKKNSNIVLVDVLNSETTSAASKKKTVEYLENIWHGSHINKVREAHIEGKASTIDICKTCPFKEPKIFLIFSVCIFFLFSFDFITDFTIERLVLNLSPVETKPFVSFGKQDPP